MIQSGAVLRSLGLGLQDKEKFRIEKSTYIEEINKLSETVTYVWSQELGLSEWTRFWC